MNIVKVLSARKLFNRPINKYRILRHCSNYLVLKDFDSMSHRDIQRLYLKSRKDTKKHGNPSHFSLQILGSGSHGAPNSLFVCSEHSRYMFNCGEGSQRLAHEHHFRFSRLDHIFFTTPSWKNIGGLSGITLTLQDMGLTSLNIHGPEGIVDAFDAMKSFVLLEHLSMNEVDCKEDNHFEDSSMSVRYVHLKSSTPDNDSGDEDAVFEDDTDYYAHETKHNGKKFSTKRKPAQKISKDVLKRPRRGKTKGCIAYICKLHPKAGALDLKKCVELGVTPGPVLGQLKSGKDVTLDDGTVIRSVDVCEPLTPGPVFIVVECPDESYLESLLAHESFQPHQKGAEDRGNIAKYIIHFTPEKILHHPRYIEWMSRFSRSTQHLTINNGNNCYNHEALHRIQHQLNLLHPTIFPILHEKIPNGGDPENPDELKSLAPFKIYRAATLNNFHLRPSLGFENLTVKVNREADIQEAFQSDGFLDELAELQTEINARSKFINESPSYPKILMLGTGSCIPNKVRNTSGILMRVDEDTSIVMDCGEGTVGQLQRFFGPSEYEKILTSIKGIYISHMHADHHLGLIGLLEEKKRITDQPIFLLAPKQIELWLKFYDKKFERIEKTYKLVPNKTLHHFDRKISEDCLNELKEKLKMNDVVTIDVHHCPHAFAVAWNLQCEKKIVYSGDTRPCINVPIIGKYCDLLIHEATMEDQLLHEAKRKMHSTISEAIKIGQDSEAKYTLLTHFSQRYSKMPRLPDSDKMPDNVCIAFDNMQFSMAELSLLPLFYPALRSLFSEFCDELELRARKRVKRDEQTDNSKTDDCMSTYT